MEGRQVLSTMVPGTNGVTGVLNGSVWHYQQNGGWFGVGGGNVAQVIESHNPAGQNELFARLNDGSIWTFTYANGRWANTGGHLDQMYQTVVGIAGTINGALYHYQDNTGWVSTGLYNVQSVVDGRNRLGQEVLYARLADNSVWADNLATGAVGSTGLCMTSLTANYNGTYGIGLDGALWRYTDVYGWGRAGGGNIAQVVESRDSAGRESMFIRSHDGSIWTYATDTGVWANTGGYLNQISTANDFGISGTINGLLYHYQNNVGWFYTGLSGVDTAVDTHNYLGQEMMVARKTDGTIAIQNAANGVFQPTFAALA